MSGWRGGFPRYVGDLAVVALIVLFAVLAVRLHDSVAGLGDMARSLSETGVQIDSAGRSTGREIRSSVDRAASTLSSLPLVGGQASAALRDAGAQSAAAVEREAGVSGARLRAAGRAGEEDAEATADLVGWLAFLVPTILLLAQVLPGRLRGAPSPGPVN